MMKTVALTFGMLLLSSLAQGKDLVVKVGGKDLGIPYRALNQEVTEKDLAKGSQNSAVECYLMHHGLLAQGKIEAASQLTTDPAATAKMMTQYRERLGAEDFKKEMTQKVTILAELLLGEVTMLVVKTPDYIVSQLLQNKNGKYQIIAGPPFSDDAKTLGKVLTMIQEGKVKL